MKRTSLLCFAALCGLAASAAPFDVVALVDSLDFAHVYDIETATGTVQTLEHVLLAHPTTVLWRDKGGSLMRYPSAEEASPVGESPLDKRKLPRLSVYGNLRLERPEPDAFGIVRGECARRGLVYGIHTTWEENHWLAYTESNWNVAHPQYMCRTRGGGPRLATASLAWPEVRAHKLRLVDERLALKPQVVFLDLHRNGGWGPHMEYVKPVIDRWRAKYGCEPPADARDPRWLALVSEDVMSYLRAFGAKCHAAGVEFHLGFKHLTVKDDYLWNAYAIDWKALAADGTLDAVVVMDVDAGAKRPFDVTREILSYAKAHCGKARLYFHCSMYAMPYGIPGYVKATGLKAPDVARELLRIAKDTGCAGAYLECVDYRNYSPGICDALGAAGDLPSLEIKHSSAFLTDAGEVASSRVDTARYGVIFPMQVGADAVAYLVNRGVYLGRIEGVERWNYDFEDGADVFLTGRTERKVALTRSGVENGRFVVRYPLNGGFVPAGARLSGRPHPRAGSGFLVNLAYSHQIAKDGTFDWRTPGFKRLVEVRQVRYDGNAMSVDPPVVYDPDHPFALGPDGWHLRALGMSVAIPEGEDLLFPVSATNAKNGRQAVGLTRWRHENGAWNPESFCPVAFNDGASEHSYTEPSAVRDAAGRLVFAARDDGRRDRSGAKPRTAFEQDLNAWISDDSGKSWRVFVHAKKMRTPGPMAVGRTVDGRIFLAANPIPPMAPGRRDYRGKLVLWPVSADGQLGACQTVCDANTEFGKNGAYWCVDHPTSAILQNADGTARSVLAYRVRDPYFYPFRPGNVFSTPSRQSGAYRDEVLSTGPAMPVWEFEAKR